MSVVRSAPTFTLVEVKEYNYEKIVLSIFQTVWKQRALISQRKLFQYFFLMLLFIFYPSFPGVIPSLRKSSRISVPIRLDQISLIFGITGYLNQHIMYSEKSNVSSSKNNSCLTCIFLHLPWQQIYIKQYFLLFFSSSFYQCSLCFVIN